MRLNPSRRKIRHMLASPQVTHAMVMSSIPPPPAASLVAGGDIADDAPSGRGEQVSGRVLWRLDRGAPHELELWVASPTRPDFTGIVEQAGWPTSATWDTADYRPLLDRLAVGQRWRFRLAVNPVVSVAGSRGTRGRLVPIIKEGEQLPWLLERAPRDGFTVPQLSTGGRQPDGSELVRPAISVVRRENAEFFRNAPDSGELVSRSTEPARGGVRVSLQILTVEGVLEVTDADALRRTLAFGLGRARGYGCGLLTLAPPA